MMNKSEMITRISRPDFAIELFVVLAMNDDLSRDEIIKQMITNPDIMVYYHCYYVVVKASGERPELFYKYWDEIATLLKHENSYHRNFALEILANLTKVDRENRFDKVFPDFFKHFNDIKFMTGQCCTRSCLKVLENKKELRDQMIPVLLEVDHRSSYTMKQKDLLKCDILEILDHFYEEISGKMGVNEFIKSAVHSKSPKTQKKARVLVTKYHLDVSIPG
jgi:hypothetical protein